MSIMISVDGKFQLLPLQCSWPWRLQRLYWNLETGSFWSLVPHFAITNHLNLLLSFSVNSQRNTNELELEKMCREKGGSRPRHFSMLECQFVQKCIEKHGFDYQRMSTDLKINVFQMTARQLEKKISMYCETISQLDDQVEKAETVEMVDSEKIDVAKDDEAVVDEEISKSAVKKAKKRKSSAANKKKKTIKQ